MRSSRQRGKQEADYARLDKTNRTKLPADLAARDRRTTHPIPSSDNADAIAARFPSFFLLRYTKWRTQDGSEWGRHDHRNGFDADVPGVPQSRES